MSETIAIPVPVETEFWFGIGEDDLQSADDALRPALEGIAYDHADPNSREGDIIREHIYKYVTDYDVEISEIRIDEVEFEDDRQSGNVYVEYHVSRDGHGCANGKLEKDKRQEIRFSIDYQAHIVLLHVLKEPILSSEQFDGA